MQTSFLPPPPPYIVPVGSPLGYSVVHLENSVDRFVLDGGGAENKCYILVYFPKGKAKTPGTLPYMLEM